MYKLNLNSSRFFSTSSNYQSNKEEVKDSTLAIVMGILRSEHTQQMNHLEDKLTAQYNNLRQENKDQINALRSETKEQINILNTKVDNLSEKLTNFSIKITNDLSDFKSETTQAISLLRSETTQAISKLSLDINGKFEDRARFSKNYRMAVLGVGIAAFSAGLTWVVAKQENQSQKER